jgi:DNA sulfur modification protein DndB
VTIYNVHDVSTLAGHARRVHAPWELKSVRNGLVSEELAQGWEVARANKTNTRLRRRKPPHGWFEDRVWILLYRLGFDHMSGQGGAKLQVAASETASANNQLDVVALDDETALLVECKSTRDRRRLPDFARVSGKLLATREPFLKAVKSQFPTEHKRLTALIMFTENIILSESDRVRAEQQNITLLDEDDLAYYEALASQIGPAAKYQFLAHVFPGKPIPGLEIVIPAIRTKMGGSPCYSFSASPEYLLKIAFVSHRARGKASDIDTYQRLIKKSRLQSIRKYITDDGIFPTNLVLNVDPRWLRFERAKQETEDDKAGVFGWLRVRPCYKAAWVIDGQHRLFGYAGHPQAHSSLVTVLCFSGLDPSEQARMFIDINAQQRKVKQSLLQELYAELHWSSDDPDIRVRAILSKAIQALDILPSSPLRGRILKADEKRDELRCISLTSIFKVLQTGSLLVGKAKDGHVVEPGPLWAGTNEATLARVISALTGWLTIVVSRAQPLWDLGSGDGGGLAMNDGLTVIVSTIRSVVVHIQSQGINFSRLTDEEVVNVARPFLQTLGDYFGNMSPEEVRTFRLLRGGQGHITGTRKCQQAIRTIHPEFNPPGLEEFLSREKAQTNTQAYQIITRIEELLQHYILEELKREYGPSEAGWWFEGVPTQVRKKVDERINDDQGKKGGKEQNFDLIDYRVVITNNWDVFQSTFGRGKGNKEARTKWIADVNELRKTVMHASKGIHLPITEEQLSLLRELSEWLDAQVTTVRIHGLEDAIA